MAGLGGGNARCRRCGRGSPARSRFIAQIDSGRHVWDMGHVWLEPVTLLWHRYLGFGETAEQSQKHINTVFAAAGIAVFYAMLLKFKLPLLRWIVATAPVAASLATLALVVGLYLRAIQQAVWRNAAVWTRLGFIAGALAWNWFFNINEPEHWFHLTVPTVFLFLVLVPRNALRWALPLWAAITITMNLALWALPEARYPLKQYQAELARDYGRNDFFLYFLAYGGGPNMSFFNLPTPYITVDNLYEDNPNDAAFEASLTQDIDAALQRHGQVVVFEALNPTNWNAP